MLASCDDGTEVPAPPYAYVYNSMYPKFYFDICDMQGVNLLYWASKFKDSDVKFDPHIYAEDEHGISPLLDGGLIIIAYDYWVAKLGQDWEQSPIRLNVQDYKKPNAYVEIEMCASPDTTYNFDIVSPENNYRWHIRAEFENHTCEYRVIRNHRIYVNDELVGTNDNHGYHLKLRLPK